MAIRTVTDAIRYVGADDNTLTLFENQYPVQPMGVSYNSYIILDEKIAVMDSVDARAAEDWISNVAQVLEGRSPVFLNAICQETLFLQRFTGSTCKICRRFCLLRCAYGACGG